MPEAEWLCYHRTGIGVPARPGFLLYDISGEKCLAPPYSFHFNFAFPSHKGKVFSNDEPHVL